MRIERRYTTEARGAYEGLAFREASPHDPARPGAVAAAVTVPEPWSEAAAAMLVRDCLAQGGVPVRLRRLEEPGIPAFLRRSAASEMLMADLAEADRFAAETDARQFFDRFAGQLAYAGWKSGYFDGESDARAFMDEIRFTLAMQKAAPEAVLVRPAGLFWAYGMIDPPAPAAPPAAPASPASLLVAAPPADDATPAIDAEDAMTVAAAGGVELRFTAATEAWRADPAAAAPGATLNLYAFRSATGAFDAAGFQHAVRLWTIALDIAAAGRPGGGSGRLALGCANLGALLAATALPYDSPRARAMAAAILALATGAALAASAEMAAELGPLEGTSARDEVLGIVAEQRRAARGAAADEASARRPLPLERAACPDEVLLGRVDRAYEAAAERGARHGFRNALVTLVAEAGIAGELLDIETPGIAPHPGPTRAEVPPSPSRRQELWPSLREALRALRYREAEIAEIAGFHAGGAAGPPPHLRSEHAPLLRSADDAAQLRMSAAVQPFVAGDVEHTVRLRTEAAAAEFQAAATRAWRLGLKMVRLCRRPAPVPASGAESVVAAPAETPGAGVPEGGPGARARQPLPDRRTGYTRKIAAGGHEAYLHTGEYADGRLGEVFIDMHRDDAAFRALMDEFSSAVSLGLQHGVPLEEFVDAFCREETAAERREAERNPASILDAVFRDLAASYLGRTELAEPAERAPADRGRGRGSARGWRLPMARAVELPMPAASPTASPPAQEPPSEPAGIRPLPKLPRTDAFPLDRLTGGRGAK